MKRSIAALTALLIGVSCFSGIIVRAGQNEILGGNRESQAEGETRERSVELQSEETDPTEGAELQLEETDPVEGAELQLEETDPAEGVELRIEEKSPTEDVELYSEEPNAESQTAAENSGEAEESLWEAAGSGEDREDLAEDGQEEENIMNSPEGNADSEGNAESPEESRDPEEDIEGSEESGNSGDSREGLSGENDVESFEERGTLGGNTESLSEGVDVGENIDSPAEAVNPADKESASDAGPCSLQIPHKLGIVIDPWETDGRGQIYSEEYVIKNAGNREGILTLSFSCKASGDGAVIKPDCQGMHDGEEKAIYLEMVFGDGTRIALSQEGMEYETVLGAGEELTVRFSGEVNENASQAWKDRDVEVAGAYSWSMVEDTQADVPDGLEGSVPDGGSQDIFPEEDSGQDIPSEESGAQEAAARESDGQDAPADKGSGQEHPAEGNSAQETAAEESGAQSVSVRGNLGEE